VAKARENEDQQQSAPDELLGVADVARLWGTGLAAVLRSIELGQLPTLDRGLLIAEGALDVPIIRRSWVERLQQDTPGASRVVDPPAGSDFHPAAKVAYDFHGALDSGDQEGLFEVCSSRSRSGRSPAELLDRWREVGSHLTQPGSGIGTTIYSLAPLAAVAARVFADTPAMPRAMRKPTPATLIDPIPLVLEGQVWRVDLQLFEQRAEWIHLLTLPLPGSEDAPGSSSSSGSSPS
jgi:hypothetical protein